MFIKAFTASVTTGEDETGTAYTNAVNGRILEVAYTKDATAPFTNGVDFVVTSETTSQAIWSQENVNATAIVRPRQAVHSTAGVALNYNDESDEPVCEPVYVADERIKIAVAQGGKAKTGAFTVIVG